MKIFIEIVLYNKKINNSITFRSLDSHKRIINQLFTQIELVIYDNSARPQKINGLNSFPTRYQSNVENGGVSAAYNYAYEVAKKHNYKWILLLDQDTELNENYFIELNSTLEEIEHEKEYTLLKV